MPKRNAQGAGSIRQRPDGKWEARFTVGRDPGTGKQKQRSIYADTQKEVLAKLKQIQADLENGVYCEPSKLTVGAWLDTWLKEYKAGIKPYTRAAYEAHIKNQIKPELGFIPLQKLQAHHVQAFYNELQKTLSPKSIKNLHGVLHGALDQAVRLGYVKANPTELCSLPRVVKKEMQVLTDETVTNFLTAISGHRFEAIFFVDLFTGLRQGEILGLTWDCVNFKTGAINVCKQLVKEKKAGGTYSLDTTKNDRARVITPATVVMEKLKERKAQQAADQLRAGPAWDNPWKLVFTNELGGLIPHFCARDAYKVIVSKMGMPNLRFHDMRHSYAVISLMSGDDVKTVQENLGHHTAAFTLDTYAHATERMKQESARRMDEYIKSVAKGNTL
jgi:integrase